MMAKVFPEYSSGRRLICERPIREKTIPRILQNGPKQQHIRTNGKDSNPKIKPVRARLFVLGPETA